jgi:hypothetical protein
MDYFVAFYLLALKKKGVYHMNYSDYFENKVASHFSDNYNVTLVSVSLDNIETIKKNVLVKSYDEVEQFIEEYDPFSVFLTNKDVVLKVYETSKTE